MLPRPITFALCSLTLLIGCGGSDDVSISSDGPASLPSLETAGTGGVELSSHRGSCWWRRDGAICGPARVCVGGVCLPLPGPGAQVCVIAGDVYAAGAEDPANVCRLCWPAASTTAWTNALDGKPCLFGTCGAGVCVGSASGCTIGGASYVAGATKPGDLCQICRPADSTQAWSNITDGAACGTDMACFSGVCTSQFPDCEIGGVSYPPNASSPSNACARCQPRQSTKAWTNAPDGTACGPSKICIAGACDSLF